MTTGNVQYVDTFADLTSYTGSSTSVSVRGNLTAGDGYEGIFDLLMGDYSAQEGNDSRKAVFVKVSGVSTTVSIWKRRMVDCIQLKWFGAVGDGDGNGGGATDNHDALQAALKFLGDNGGGRLLINGEAIYNCKSGVTVSANSHIDMALGAALDFSFLDFGTVAILAAGTFGPEINLSTAATRGGRIVEVASDPSMSAGDWFLLLGQRDSLGSLAAAEWRLGVTTANSGKCYFGEPCQATSVTTGSPWQLTTANGLIFPGYGTTPDSPDTRVSTIKKINFLRGLKITGGKIILKGAGTTDTEASPRIAIRLNLCYMPEIRGVTFDLGGYNDSPASRIQPGIGLVAYGCYRGNFEVTSFRTPGWTKPTNADHSNFNAFKNISSWYCKWNYWDYNGSQGLDVTYANGSGKYFPSIHPQITGGAINPLETGLTFHPGCYGGTVENFTAEGCPDTGLYIRSRGVTVINPYISSGTTNTGSASGILFEGWGIDGSVIGGHIEGYNHGFRHNRDTAGGTGPAQINMTISGTEFRFCGQGIRIAASTAAPASSDPSGLSISHITLTQCVDFGINLENYANDVTISDVQIDTMTGSAARGIKLPADAVLAKIRDVTGRDIGASNYLIDNSLGFTTTGRSTFAAATYPTQGHRIDWRSVSLAGTGQLCTITPEFCNQPNGDYTLLLSDAETALYHTNPVASVLTVPLESSVPMPATTQIAIYPQPGAMVSVAGATGVSITSIGNLRTIIPTGRALLKKKSGNIWSLTGDLLVTVPGETPEVTAYIDAMLVKPDATRRALLNTLIGGLISNSIWYLLDWFCLLASHDSQAALINARKPPRNAYPAGGISFTVDRGWTGDPAVPFYLDLQESFAAPGNLLSMTSATIGVWCNQDNGTTGLAYQLGTSGGSGNFNIGANNSGNESYKVSDGTSDISRSSTSRKGHRTGTRTSTPGTGINPKKSFFNGALVSSSTTTASTPSTDNGTILHNNTAFCADRIAAFYSGSFLTDAQVGTLHGLLNAYLTAIGGA